MSNKGKLLFDSSGSIIIPKQTATDYDRSELSRMMEQRTFKERNTKPLLMLLSHDQNCREVGIVTHTRHMLQDALGFDKTPDILTAAGQNSLQTLSRNALWHLQKFSKSYSAIVTLDPWVTFVVNSVMSDMQSTTPLVFVGVDQRVAAKMVGSLDQPQESSTGVQTVFPYYEDQIGVLRDLRPTGGRVILPYSNLFGHESDARDILFRDYSDLKDACESFNFTVESIPLEAQDNVVSRLRAVNACENDIVCMPVDSPVLSQASNITQFCVDIGATAYAFDLTAVARGAAIGSGSSGYAYAQKLASILYDIVGEKKAISDVPVETIVENSESRYNEMALRGQGITPTTRDWRLMKLRSIFAYDQ